MTNHPPAAGQVRFQRVTNDNTIVIPISQLLATTSDADGDTVSFAAAVRAFEALHLSSMAVRSFTATRKT